MTSQRASALLSNVFGFFRLRPAEPAIANPPVASTISSESYRPDIDGLRAVAVVSVVAFHAFPSYIRSGFVGVDIFFVISGYLITSIILNDLLHNRFSLGTFYARRIRRIFPALAVVLTAVWAIGLLLLFPNEFQQVGKHLLAGSAFVSNFALWKESGYFDAAAETKPLLNLWSLGIEEQFYLIWPVAVCLAWNARRIPLLVALLAVGSFTVNLALMGQHDLTAAFYSPAARFWELMAGCSLAVGMVFGASPALAATLRNSFFTIKIIPASLRKGIFALIARSQFSTCAAGKLRGIASCVGALLIILSVFSLREKAFPGWWALAPVVGACLLIVAGPRALLNRTVLSSRPIVFFGLISYPLYLWHWPLLVYGRMIWQEPSTGIKVGLVSVSAVLSYLTYVIVEKPFRYGSFKPVAVRILIPVIITTGVAGLFTYVGQGFASRYPEYKRSLAAFKYNFSASYRLHECFLTKPDEPSKFRNCVENDDGRPLLMLLGDSHAAHLYPGLKKTLKDFRIAQFTFSNCLPLLGVEPHGEPYCDAISNHVLTQAKILKPERTIFAASWPSYGEWRSTVGLSLAIEKLRSAGVREIVVIGPVPIWSKSLPSMLSERIGRTMLDSRPPVRMQANGSYAETVPNFRSAPELDEIMSQHFGNAGVTYVSPWSLFCNGDGCLTRADDTAESVVSWDTSHLTTRGSEWLVERFPAAALLR